LKNISTYIYKMQEITIILNKPALNNNDKQQLCLLYSKYYSIHILPHHIDDYFLTFNIMKNKIITLNDLNHSTFFTYGIFGEIIDNIYYTCKDINKTNTYLTKIYDTHRININNTTSAKKVKDHLFHIYDRLDPFLNNKFDDTTRLKSKINQIINQIDSLINN